MHPASATPLPPFDQAQLDRRFLAELARLLDAEAFATSAAWAGAVGVSPNSGAAIAGGRYHASLKLLYATLRAYPAFDFGYVVFGSAVYARPEPPAAPKRPRGRPPRIPIPATA
jgi:hypothetical protein